MVLTWEAKVVAAAAADAAETNWKHKVTPDLGDLIKWEYSHIGPAPTRQYVIIWTNDNLFNSCIYASLGLNELIRS